MFSKENKQTLYNPKSKLVERRESSDRRDFKASQTFPLVDSSGKLVKKDRRIMPDRRISNIQVKEHHIDLSKASFSKR